MSDNDSLRPEDFEPHRVEPEKRNPRATIMAIFRENPLLRLVALILPVVAAVVLIIGVFGHSKQVVQKSTIAPGSAVVDKENVATNNQKYQEALDQRNKEKIQEAQKNGTDIIANTPTVQKNPDSAVTDPLVPFNPNPVVVQAQAVPQINAPTKGAIIPTIAPPQQAPQQAPPMKLDAQLSQSFGAEMRSILTGLNSHPVTVVRIGSGKSDTPPANSKPATPVGPQPDQSPKIIMAGTVVYGQTITEADSDIPAPVLVTVLSGPLSGARAIGSFRTVHAADDFIILAFGEIIKGQKEYHVNAIAMDPETTLTGLETDIDHHYFERFVLPAAAGFISGVGTYTQQAGATTTISNVGVTQAYPPLNTHQEILSGLGQGANAISSAVQAESNVQVTVHVAGGTPIGIMFINSVHEVSE